MFGLVYIILHFTRSLRVMVSDPEFKGLFLFVILILLTGTAFYSQFEGWSLLDSLYFSTTTLTTVGLGDLHPVTAIGKIFTIIYIFVGIGIILGFINSLASHSKRENPVLKLFGDPKIKKH